MNTFDNEMRRFAYELMEKHAPEFLTAIKRDLKLGTDPEKIETLLKKHPLNNTSITINTAILAVRYMRMNPSVYQE